MVKIEGVLKNTVFQFGSGGDFNFEELIWCDKNRLCGSTDGHGASEKPLPLHSRTLDKHATFTGPEPSVRPPGQIHGAPQPDSATQRLSPEKADRRLVIMLVAFVLKL